MWRSRINSRVLLGCGALLLLAVLEPGPWLVQGPPPFGTTTQTVLSSQRLPAQALDTPQIALTTMTRGVTAWLDSSTWTAGETVQVELFGSVDGGLSWASLGAGVLAKPSSTARDPLRSSFSVHFAHPVSGLLVKARLTPSAPITAGVTMETNARAPLAGPLAQAAVSYDLTLAGVQITSGHSVTLATHTSVTNDVYHVTAGYTTDAKPVTLSDSGGEIWTWSIAEANPAGNGWMRPAWAKVTTGDASRTITMTASIASAEALLLCADMLGGINTTTPIDQISLATGSSATPVGSTITTTSTNALIMGYMLESFGGANKISTGTIAGVSAIQGSERDVDTSWFGASDEYRIVSSTGNYDARWTLTVSDTWAAGVVAYQASTGGGGGTPTVRKLKLLPLLGVGR